MLERECPLCADKTCSSKLFPDAAYYDTKRPMPQVETTATVAAVGPFAQIASAEGLYLQRLDAQPSVSLTAVRQQRVFLDVCSC